MTQIKEKTGICKSVVIATVVAIRGVVKNGFHCIYIASFFVRREHLMCLRSKTRGGVRPVLSLSFSFFLSLTQSLTLSSSL